MKELLEIMITLMRLSVGINRKIRKSRIKDISHTTNVYKVDG